MKNKNGFTLIELLAVIAIIAIISLIAIPNIVGLSTGIRKDNMLDDAKKLISLAKYQVAKSYDIRNSTTHTFTFAELNINKEIGNDPDGGEYVAESSYVKYTNDGTAKYCVYLIGSMRSVLREVEGEVTCVPESELYSRSNVVDNE